MRLAVLASGEGTNLQALLDTVHGREAEVVAVASDKPGARDAAMADWLDERLVDLVVLAGYMAILDAAFIARFRDRIINVHPSLLPAFAGVRAIEQALDYGVKVFGVTVHLVDEGVDTGPIVLQAALELPGATDADAVHAALQPLEHRLLPEAVRLFAAGRIQRDRAHPRRVVVR